MTLVAVIELLVGQYGFDPHAVDNAIVAVVPAEDLQRPDAEISQAALQQIIARLNNS